MSSRRPVPVIAVSGYLGAGKTILLNHLLRTPGASLGVLINDFGDINVDAALVAGEVDEPVGISGGCLCCLPDAGGIDASLARLVRARAEQHEHHHDHVHARSAGVPAGAPVDAGRLADLLEPPPATAYRLKGIVDVAGPGTGEPRSRRDVVNAVAGRVHLASERTVAPVSDPPAGFVAIGTELADDVEGRIADALAPAAAPSAAADVARLERLRRRSA